MENGGLTADIIFHLCKLVIDQSMSTETEQSRTYQLSLCSNNSCPAHDIRGIISIYSVDKSSILNSTLHTCVCVFVSLGES